MKKVGNYTLSSYVISESRFSKIYQAIDAKQNLVAVKEIKRSDIPAEGQDLRSEQLVKDLLASDNQYIVRLIDVVEQGPFIYFVEELGISNLAKEVRKFEIKSMNERQALYNFTQILHGYKFFFKRNVIYRHLNPQNILRIDQKLKLCIPSTLFNLGEGDAARELASEEYLCLAPEQLVGSTDLSAKADVWALGCILYFMLFGSTPWADFALPKKYVLPNDPAATLRFRNFGLWQFARATGLRFPTPNPYHASVTHLLMRMLEFEPDKRIAFGEILEHSFLDYFGFLGKNNKAGGSFEIGKTKLFASTFTPNGLAQLINEFDKNQVKKELKSNFKRKSKRLQQYQVEASSEIDLTPSPETSKLPEAELKMDDESLSELQRVCSEIDQKGKALGPTPIRQSSLPLDAQNTDKILAELEDALEGGADLLEEEANKPDMDFDQLASFITALKRRIMLKISAFDEIRLVINSAYVFAFRFFLLKSSLFDLIKLEKKLLQEENPFKSVHWAEFKKKPAFAKLVNAVFKQEDRIMDLIDDYLPKTVALLKSSKIAFNQSFLNYLNKDPYQDASVVLALLLENLLLGSLIPRVKTELDTEKKTRLVKFAILVKLILMIDQYGKFVEMEQGLEFADVWRETSASNDPNILYTKFNDLVLNG